MRTSQHSNIRFRLATLLGALILSGCNCHPPPVTQKVHPDVVPSPAAISFSACPTQDENGEAVADVYPDVQTLSLQNIGTTSANLTYEIRGSGKDHFSLVEDSKLDSLADGDTGEVKIQFTPLKAGDVQAELVIDDGDETTDPLVISLLGSGINLPAQPTIQISYETTPGGEMQDCIEDVNGQISNCLVMWPSTFIDQTSVMNLKIKNAGCPALKITDLSLQPINGSGTPQFFFEEPAVPPTPDAPLVLSMADGTQETNVRIRFEPKDDGTANEQRYALLNVTSNSPKSPSQLTAYGEASQPAIYATPTYCDYTDPNDLCGGTKVTTSGNNKASIFKVWNGGNSDVVLEKPVIRAPNSGRFTISKSVEGITLTPGGDPADLEIQYTDDPVYVTDLLDLSAHAPGQPDGSAGRVTLRVSGGVLPCLTVDPAQQLDFSAATTNPAVLPVKMCDCDGGGILNLTRFQVVQGSGFFAVKTPPAKTSLAANECTTAEIQYTKPVTGGLQTGTLEIESNDRRYAAPSYYRVNLFSSAPLNQVPVAVLEGPNGQTNAFSVDLSTLNPKQILLDGTNSYDPPQNDPVSSYTFYLDHKPYGAGGVILQTINNPGVDVSGQEITESKVVLVMDPNITGEYRVALVVKDATGQKSSAEIIKILANP